MKPKSVWKLRALIFHFRMFLTHSTSTKQVRTRCTSTGNPKAFLENNWRLASYYVKPHCRQNTPCFGKIPSEKVFLLIGTKIIIRCILAKSQMEAMKGYPWFTENTSIWERFFCKFTSEIVLELWHYVNNSPTSRKEPTNHIEKKIEHNSRNWENQSPQNGAIFKITSNGEN